MGVGLLRNHPIAPSRLPEYTYTGAHQLIDDGGGNWRIRLLTSGTLTLKRKTVVDVFLVGGGGGGSSAASGYGGSGGGGGYTKTEKIMQLDAGMSYNAVIGAGGAAGQATGGNMSAFASGGTGGETAFNGVSAAGGAGGRHYAYNSQLKGGDGGSGGSATVAYPVGDGTIGSGYAGGTDGGDGYSGSGSARPGTGQHTTTREFGDTAGALYSGGGGLGGNGSNNTMNGKGGAGGGGNGMNTSGTQAEDGQTWHVNGVANTGGGGGGGAYTGNYFLVSGSGGAGIVIIRNAR